MPKPELLLVEPLSASVDLFAKRAAPTLRFPIRKPRFPQGGVFAVTLCRAGAFAHRVMLVLAGAGTWASTVG